MLEAGNYLWNAGIFLFKAADMVAAFKTFAPDTYLKTEKAVETAKLDLGFLRLNPHPWNLIDEISIDYAIMEKATNLVAIPFLSKWSDLGDWDAVWNDINKDASGVALSRGAHSSEWSDTLLRSESLGQQIVGLLNNIIAIAMPDAVLVMQKDKAQDVKKVVELLKINNISQAETSPKIIGLGDGLKVLFWGRVFKSNGFCKTWSSIESSKPQISIGALGLLKALQK